MRIVLILMRVGLFIGVLYLFYSFYKALQKPPEEKPSKEAIASTCPSPKVFIDYTEGRIKGKQKKAIDGHIARCKNCQDAVENMFDMPKSEEPQSKSI